MSTLSREAIAAAAIALADAEGLEAVSMRRVGGALGVGTMSLYHYVRTKAELLSLMGDAIAGEFLVPADAMPADWRGGLRAIALRTKASFDRHPWMLLGMMHTWEGVPGENLLRHADQTVGTLAGLGLGPAERMHLTGAVDEYVMGFAFRERMDRMQSEPPDAVMQEWFAATLASGDYPNFRDMFGPEEPTAASLVRFHAEARELDRFGDGLELVLDGIEVHLARRPAAG